MSALVLVSPLDGWATPLAEVPDPAFAQGLLGDGVAIDPTSTVVRAPCDGVVLSVHRARHACTLRAANGAELLLHIGIDTVELEGTGFRALVEGGQRVRAGDPLIDFDMDVVLRKARSLHTAIILLNGDDYAVVERVHDREVAAGDRLLVIRGGAAEPAAAEPAAAPSSSGPTAERRVRLPIANGLHARPAAAFARRAKQHTGTVAVACGPRSANGKSMVSLMALGARHGDELAITASGPQGGAVAAELAALVEGGLGDPVTAALPARPDDAAPLRPGEEVLLRGAAAAPGLALGRAVPLTDDPGATVEVVRDGDGIAAEERKLAAAIAQLRGQLEQTIASAAARSAAAAEIFRAHLDLLDDPELVEAAGREIAAGHGAVRAWRAATGHVAASLRGLGDRILAERAGDLRDLERSVVAILTGGRASRLPAELPEGAVLVADEIAPSELAAAPPGRLAGLCTARGGVTSHVSLLAAGMGIPAVVALGETALRVPAGAPLVVDGDRGEVRVYPAASARAASERAIRARAARAGEDLAAAHQPARTADGAAIAVLANLGRPADAARARELGAEGCGLLRTEFLYLDRQGAPSEEEQAACYQAMADALDARPLIIRTLDAGGDKPLPFLPLAREENPALGVRGVRLSLRHPELLRAQIRAILRVEPAGVCRILLPMITAIAELRAVRVVVDAERRALGVAPVALGVMIEVPVAALGARGLAAEADFFSIGTNDLSQYALAMDRGNAGIAGDLDALHPGVLRLIASTAAGARAHRRPVGVCGDAAADPQAVPLLIGLGVDSLSTVPAAVPGLKALLRTLDRADCARAAERALELESAEAVRALVVKTWPSLAGQGD